MVVADIEDMARRTIAQDIQNSRQTYLVGCLKEPLSRNCFCLDDFAHARNRSRVQAHVPSRVCARNRCQWKRTNFCRDIQHLMPSNYRE